jgi:hypothetical protein
MDTRSFWVVFGGILGACIILYGLRQNPAQPYYIVGAGFLLTMALYFRLTYFIALELILLAGHGAIFFGIGPILQVIIPIMLCFQLLLYYLLSGELQTVFRLIGIAGIGLLSIGFSYADPSIFFFGSLFVATFSFYSVYKGSRVALVWAILNSIFVGYTGWIFFIGS